MTNSCPTRHELVRYSVGDLPEDAADRVARHLVECSVCDETISKIDDSADTLLTAFAAAVSDDPVLAEPQLEDALSRIESLETISPASRQTLRSVRSKPLGVLGGYELIGVLGRGGMGTVYQALHKKLHKLVALKLLPADRLQDEESIQRFEREMKAVGQLNHPNIVAAYDAGEIDGQHYLVMELVEGLDLSTIARHLGSREISVADACELVRQAAVGLEHAYHRGLVHRDLKPSNLILGVAASPRAGHNRGQREQPRVKILDFGLALLDDHHLTGELTTSGLMMGTVDYMAPEQASDSHEVDIRADLYALGATLFRLLTGEPPFAGRRGSTPFKRFVTKTSQSAPSIAAKRPDVPAELSVVVDRLLATDPANRLSTPGELANALTPFAESADLPALLDRATAARAAGNDHQRPTTGGDSGKSEYTDTNIWQQPAVIGRASSFEAASQLPRDSVPQVLSQNRNSRFATIRSGLVVVALALLALLAAGVYRIATDNGELVISSTEPGVEVTIKRNGQPADNLEVSQGQTSTRVRSGEIEVLIQGADADTLIATSDQTGQPKFTLARNGRVVVEIARRTAQRPVDHVSDSNAANDRSAAEWLLSIKGKIKVRVAGETREIATTQELPRESLEITSIDLLDNPAVDDIGLQHLAGLTNLTSLNLAKTPVTTAGLDQLRNLTNLTLLDLSQTKVDDTGLKKLHGLTRIVQLSLMLTPVSDAGLQHLERMSSLADLNLDFTQISDVGLKHLVRLPKLVNLHLCGTQVSDEALELLPNWPELSELRLNGTRVSDIGLQHLRDVPQLTLLYLDGTQVDDEGLKPLKSLMKLNALSLSKTRVTDAGLEQVTGLANLEELYLSEADIGDAGLKHLKGLSRLRRLFLPGTRVSDGGIAVLADLPSLMAVDLRQTAVSSEGCQRLEAARPGIYVAR